MYNIKYQKHMLNTLTYNVVKIYPLKSNYKLEKKQ